MVKSTVFDVNLNEENPFGVEAQLLSPSVNQGLFLFVKPLCIGTHTIEFVGSHTCPGGETFTAGARYTIKVV